MNCQTFPKILKSKINATAIIEQVSQSVSITLVSWGDGECSVVQWNRWWETAPLSFSEDVAQSEEQWTSTQLMQVQFASATRDFSPKVSFQCGLSYRGWTPPCASACINICSLVKDPVVLIRVQWIVETLEHPTL